MKALITLVLLTITANSYAGWDNYMAETGFTEFRGERIYQVAGIIESDSKFQWRLAYLHAETDTDIPEGDAWFQLSFQQAFKLPVTRINFFVGASYTLDANGHLAPGLGSKANFHLGFYRDFGSKWRVSIRHDSNGDLATKECGEFQGERVCTGTNNTSLNFVTLGYKF